MSNKIRRSKALRLFLWAKKRIDIQHAVDLQVSWGVEKAEAEENVWGLMQILISHHVNDDKSPATYVLLTGPICKLYEALRRQDSVFFAKLQAEFGIGWGHVTLDGVASPKVANSGGVKYTLDRLKADYGPYLNKSFDTQIFAFVHDVSIPAALIWKQHGNTASPPYLDLRNARSIQACWPTA